MKWRNAKEKCSSSVLELEQWYKMQWWMKSNVVCVSKVCDVGCEEEKKRKEEKIWGKLRKYKQPNGASNGNAASRLK